MELAFTVVGAARVPYAAVPTLAFSVRIEAPGGEDVRSILLDTQIQIAARRRRYDSESDDRLFELFGAPGDWGRTLRTLLWTRATTVVPPFQGSTTIDIQVPCTYDLDVTASRYLDALRAGEVPLELLFSGTVFCAGPAGLQAQRISWQHEAEYRLPVAVWRETIDRHFPGTAWVRLGRDAFERLAAYKSRHALASWDEALEALLPAGEEAETWTR